MKRLCNLVISVSIILLSSCASLRNSPKYQLSEGVYEFRHRDTDYESAYVEHVNDTLKLYPVKGDSPLLVKPSEDKFFRLQTFDVDLITVVFKYRTARVNLPSQVNTNLNGSIYLGYRVDRFHVHYKETPAGLKKSNYHRAFTAGAFMGFGATAVNPWTTNYQITDEYDGVVFTRGLAMMAGFNNLTVGIGLGWDYLTNRDKEIWIYQNKPWLGLTLGLNVN
jgi:hypothetical protein